MPKSSYDISDDTPAARPTSPAVVRAVQVLDAIAAAGEPLECCEQ